MLLKTPYLPNLHLLCGRAKKSTGQRLKEQADSLRGLSPGQWESMFGEMLRVETSGRRRVFDRATTFWAFFGQVLQGGTCRTSTRQVQVARYFKKLSRISNSNSAYCQARKRLDLSWLEELADQSIQYLERNKDQKWNWNQRRILLVDGSSCQLPDTPANQEAYPQPAEQKPGCGHPVMQLVGLFDLANGALVKWEKTPLQVHEAGMFGDGIHQHLHPGDIIVADRAYGSFLNFTLVQSRGADAVFRLHQARKFKFPKGQNDMVVSWDRPSMGSRPDYYMEEEWAVLPEKLKVRLVKVKVQINGFRPTEFILATTLMDTPVEDLAMLYFRRWKVEVFFRDIKTTLGMELLRGKTPDIAEKEVTLHLLVYNLLRALMQEASRLSDVPIEKMSFTGSRDSASLWIDTIANAPSQKLRKEALMELYRCIAGDPLVIRPNRSEPRTVKRRPKGYQLLTRPRKEMIVSLSRKRK
jgi:hypothetical protein